MKRDKWFLNSSSKWNMLKGLKNIYDWYLILTFPTTIFLKVHVHYRHKLFFFWRFSRPRGVRIMHQCALYNPKNGILLLRVWGRTVTRKNGKNSDNFNISSLQSLKRHFPKTHAVPYVSHISMKSTYLKFKILLLTWMVSRYLRINNFGFDYRQLIWTRQDIKIKVNLKCPIRKTFFVPYVR